MSRSIRSFLDDATSQLRPGDRILYFGEDLLLAWPVLLEQADVGHLLGMSTNQEAVAVAQATFPESQFAVGDPLQLTIPTNEVDFVIVNNVFSRLRPRQWNTAFREFYRVLEEHGRMIVYENRFGIRDFIKWEPYIASQAYVPLQGSALLSRVTKSVLQYHQWTRSLSKVGWRRPLRLAHRTFCYGLVAVVDELPFRLLAMLDLNPATIYLGYKNYTTAADVTKTIHARLVALGKPATFTARYQQAVRSIDQELLTRR